MILHYYDVKLSGSPSRSNGKRLKRPLRHFRSIKTQHDMIQVWYRNWNRTKHCVIPILRLLYILTHGSLAVSVSRPCINTEKMDYWLINTNAFYKMLKGSGWKLILFSEFSIVAWSSQSANCPSLRADLWPNEMKSQLTRNGFSNVNSMAPEVFSLISSVWGYVANTSPFSIMNLVSVLYPGEWNMPAAPRWVVWHWEILNCIFQDRLFVPYTHKDGEKISKSFL